MQLNIMEDNLKVYELTSDDDFGEYENFLSKIDSTNPFYKKELLNVSSHSDDKLMYFVYEVDSIPNVLMPFYKRKIDGPDNELLYSDVISPYGYSGPLFKQGIKKEVIVLFWNQVDDWYLKNNVVSEFIRFSLNNNHECYTGETVHTLNNVRGRIVDEKNQWDNLKLNVKKNYKKALKSELECKIYSKKIDKSVVKDFYDIYISTMKRNSANVFFYHSLDYFEDFIDNNEDRFILAIIYKDNIAISSELVLLSNNTMFSFLGGTNADYFRLRPNDFLKIEVMKWGRENRYKFYLLGGGLKDGDNLYIYKKKYFPNDTDLAYYTGRKIVNKKIYEQLVRSNPNVKNMELDISATFFPLYRY